jgi:two-component system, chemotaxis family, CheB/CheR fusion protein
MQSMNEELQSTNEELQMLNHELSAKVSELSRLNNDMKNLLDGTELTTLFLDNDLNVRLFTTGSNRIFKLMRGDVGRPITDIASDLDFPGLADQAREVLRTLLSHERQVATRDGRWFMMRIMPYRTLENMFDGVVMTFWTLPSRKPWRRNCGRRRPICTNRSTSKARNQNAGTLPNYSPRKCRGFHKQRQLHQEDDSINPSDAAELPARQNRA